MVRNSNRETVEVILFDGKCGACSSIGSFWEPLLEKHGFRLEPLQSDWVQEKVQLTTDELLYDMTLLLPEGDILRGVEVYRYVWRQIWWLKPLYWISRLPMVTQAMAWAYRRFADRRYQISRVCGLDEKAFLKK